MLSSPHAHRVPSDATATAKSAPAETAFQVSLVGIWKGELTLGDVVLLPTWPLLSSPHAHRVPSDATATVKSAPAATAFQVVLVAVTIWVGVVTLVVVPVPNWPLPLPPNAQRVPSDLRAMVKFDPALIVAARASHGQTRISNAKTAASKAYDFPPIKTPSRNGNRPSLFVI
jgi:hypothetical protein